VSERVEQAFDARDAISVGGKSFRKKPASLALGQANGSEANRLIAAQP